LLQSACDGVIASDMTGKIIIFNDAAVEVTGHRGVSGARSSEHQSDLRGYRCQNGDAAPEK